MNKKYLKNSESNKNLNHSLLNDKFKENIGSLLDEFDNVRDLLKGTKIEVPTIIAIGDQSSGKSSLLDSISGIYLPKGNGRVTLCPIQIQMRKKDKYNKSNYAIVKIQNDKEINIKCSLEELENNVKICQEKIKKICDEKKKKIISKEIQIRVYNNDSPELTLTDLPGLIYNDAENDIKKLYEKYMNEKTIILTVCSANNDLDSSESIKYAKKYSENSIIIFTKFDEVINNSNGQELYNKVMKSEIHNYKRPIIVRNMTLNEYENKVSQSEVRKKEMEIIENDKYLSQLPNDCKGINSLIKLLIEYQKDILCKNRNNLLNEINSEIKRLEEEKSQFPPCAETNEEKMNILDECCRKFKNLIENKNLFNSKNISIQLNEKLEKFKSEFHKDIKIFLDNNYVQRVANAIKNSSEINLKNFYNLDCVHQFIHEQIEDYFLNKCQIFINEIETFMFQILKNFIVAAFKEYESLTSFVINIYEEKITEQKKFLYDYFLTVSKIEKENIYTINPEYLKLVDTIVRNLEDAIDKNKSEFYIPNIGNYPVFLFENYNIEKVIISIYSYCYIFENRFLDSFFLCIIHAFLNYFTNEPTRIIRKYLNISLIKDSPDIKAKRDSLNKLLKTLYDAKKKLIKLF